jgi:hypothetical protein
VGPVIPAQDLSGERNQSSEPEAKNEDERNAWKDGGTVPRASVMGAEASRACCDVWY